MNYFLMLKYSRNMREWLPIHSWVSKLHAQCKHDCKLLACGREEYVWMYRYCPHWHIKSLTTNGFALFLSLSAFESSSAVLSEGLNTEGVEGPVHSTCHWPKPVPQLMLSAESLMACINPPPPPLRPGHSHLCLAWDSFLPACHWSIQDWPTILLTSHRLCSCRLCRSGINNKSTRQCSVLYYLSLPLLLLLCC